MSLSPRVSVVLPAYNAQRYLGEAMSSVLEQTLQDFEFVIVDDGSSDRTPELIRDLARQDARVRPMRAEHVGIVAALNAGIRIARAPLIARMDADDVCMPQRFERQVAYLGQHPGCVAVGSWVLLTDPYGSDLTDLRTALTHEQIEADLLKANGWAMFHPTVMMRREPVLSVGGYRRQYQWSEDIDLFLRLAEVGRLANIPEVLLRYRQHPSSVNRTRRNTQLEINRRLLEETYQRRGLGPLPGHLPERHATFTPFELARSWGWQALTNHNWKAARRHALSAIKAGPLKYDSWTLAYRSVWHPGK